MCHHSLLAPPATRSHSRPRPPISSAVRPRLNPVLHRTPSRTTLTYDTTRRHFAMPGKLTVEEREGREWCVHSVRVVPLLPCTKSPASRSPACVLYSPCICIRVPPATSRPAHHPPALRSPTIYQPTRISPRLHTLTQPPTFAPPRVHPPRTPNCLTKSGF